MPPYELHPYFAIKAEREAREAEEKIQQLAITAFQEQQKARTLEKLAEITADHEAFIKKELARYPDESLHEYVRERAELLFMLKLKRPSLSYDQLLNATEKLTTLINAEGIALAKKGIVV